MKSKTRLLVPLTAALLALSAARLAGAQAPESLTAAKDLYASASYEEALTVLNRLKASGPALVADESRGIEQYRALCLLALGRTGEAERAIEEIVATEPTYQPKEADTSPRVRAAFADVRRRMLPSIVQQRYGMAKATYDRKDYRAAAEQFKATLEMFDDPDMQAASKDPGLAAVRTLAAGFLELSVAAATPPPPPKVEAPPPAPVVPAPPRVYALGEAGVIPPVVVRQEMPRWQAPPSPSGVASTGRGVLEVLINELGEVEAVAMREPVHRLYDAQLLAAARTWRYRPATKDGVPVRFRKMIQISLER